VLFGKPLRNSLKNHRALRFGKYRIIYKIISKDIFILAVAHRQNIYKEVLRRLS